jgi:xanthine dehydrogenase molybdopterin-binding subunit B
VEGEYTTGAQEQLYIENNGMIAALTPRRESRCGARCNVPITFTRRSWLCANLPAEKVRVVQMETGGAFGGKEEYPSMIAAHAALLAIKSGKTSEDYL